MNKNQKELKIKPLDIVIIATVLLISVLPLFLLNGKTGGSVIITWHGTEIYRGSLDTDIELKTPDGKNTILIQGGEARMEIADCPDKLCVKSGVAKVNKPIICLPNEVVIYLESANSELLDGITK
ncbi:MAG: NusG domain II-containing protein [Clostridia bacterium]